MSSLPKNIRPGARAGEFLITPDAGRWYLAAAGSVLFGLLKISANDTPVEIVPVFLFTAFAVGMAQGKLSWIRVGRDALEVRNVFGRKQYQWDDVSEFSYKSVGVGLYRQKLVMFSLRNKTGLWSNVSRLMAGGTESIPAIGLPAEQLTRILNKARLEYADPLKSANDPLISRTSKPQPQKGSQPEYRAPRPAPPHKNTRPAVSIEAPRVVRQPRASVSATSSRSPIDSRQKPLIS